MFVFLRYGGQITAQMLAPPKYPNSYLMTQKSGGGNQIFWKRNTYHTTDNLDEVLDYMEQQMPGFNKTKHQSIAVPVYENSACNEDWLAQTFATHEGYPPCVGVSIYLNPNSPTETLIVIGLSWATM